MKKLRLDLDALTVDSFSTKITENGTGTVEARAATEWNTCGTTCNQYCSWTNGVYACKSVCGPACIA